MKAKKRKSTQGWTEAQSEEIDRLCRKAIAQMDAIDNGIANVEKNLDAIDNGINKTIDDAISGLDWLPDDDDTPQEPEPAEPPVAVEIEST